MRGLSRLRQPPSQKLPSSTISRLSISTTSSAMLRLSGGMDPGERYRQYRMWTARGRTKGVGFGTALIIEHRTITVISGRWVPRRRDPLKDIGIAATDSPCPPWRFPLPDHPGDGVPHAAQMHRVMRRIGVSAPCASKQGAGEIQPFLDVDRCGGGLQHHAHFLGDGHKRLLKISEPHRIDPGSGGALASAGRRGWRIKAAFSPQAVLPAGSDHRGRPGWSEQHRAGVHPRSAHRVAGDVRHRPKPRPATACGSAVVPPARSAARLDAEPS